MAGVQERLLAPCVNMAVGHLRRNLELKGYQAVDRELVVILSAALQQVLLQHKIDGNEIAFLRRYHEQCDVAGKLL